MITFSEQKLLVSLLVLAILTSLLAKILTNTNSKILVQNLKGSVLPLKVLISKYIKKIYLKSPSVCIYKVIVFKHLTFGIDTSSKF
jgi:hypothetical protein